MRDERPSFRLTGGTALQSGRVAETTVCVAGGHIAADAADNVDVSGHLILPGIVDLRSSAWMALAQSNTPSAMPPALTAACRELARHGVTSAWLSVGWMRGDPLGRPDIAEAARDALPQVADTCGISLALRLEADIHLSELAGRLTRFVEDAQLAYLGMLPLANLLKDSPGSEPGAQAAWARIRAMAPAAKAAALAASQAKAATMPRHVCQIAAACDAAGIRYGSLYDRDAEAREHFRMLGASLADAPRSRGAASSAHAMGDPVLLEARDVIGPTKQQSWVAAGLVSALVSGDTPSAPLRAALALDAQDIMPLSQAWSLISRLPAQIAGLSDRGVIAVGKRADLVILDAGTGHVAATLSGGRVVAGQGRIAEALVRVSGLSMAAE